MQEEEEKLSKHHELTCERKGNSVRVNRTQTNASRGRIAPPVKNDLESGSFGRFVGGRGSGVVVCLLLLLGSFRVGPLLGSERVE